MDFPQLLTEAEAADWLGVPIEAVALWARDGKLLAAARTDIGRIRPPHPQPRASRKQGATRGAPQSDVGLSSFRLYP